MTKSGVQTAGEALRTFTRAETTARQRMLINVFFISTVKKGFLTGVLKMCNYIYRFSTWDGKDAIFSYGSVYLMLWNPSLVLK